jgi:hypothetical protein
MTMSLSVCYEYSRLCDVRSIVLMAVESCSRGISEPSLGHGKSPCFLRCGVLKAVGVDAPLLIFAPVDGEKFLECAYCYGK